MNEAIGGELYCPYPAVPAGNGAYCEICGPSHAPPPHVKPVRGPRRWWRRSRRFLIDLVARLGGAK